MYYVIFIHLFAIKRRLGVAISLRSVKYWTKEDY